MRGESQDKNIQVCKNYFFIIWFIYLAIVLVGLGNRNGWRLFNLKVSRTRCKTLLISMPFLQVLFFSSIFSLEEFVFSFSPFYQIDYISNEVEYNVELSATGCYCFFRFLLLHQMPLTRVIWVFLLFLFCVMGVWLDFGSLILVQLWGSRSLVDRELREENSDCI